MSNYSKTHVAADAPRTELHDTLKLSGAEVSINHLPAGTVIPFYHKHKENEEIYIISKGKGFMEIDGENVPLEAGDVLRIDPAAKRKLHVEEDMTEICIQVKAGSLTQWTMTDAEIVE